MSADGETPGRDGPGCRLFLISPVAFEPAAFARQLDGALAEGRIAGFCLRAPSAERAAQVQPLCRAHGVAFLIEDDLALALELGADGLHLSGTATVRSARQALGDERIVGAACGRSRHEAMVAGEDGADYVVFGDPGRAPDQTVVDLVAWWSELFVLPSLVVGRIDSETLGPLVREGADFLGVAEAVWDCRDGAGAAVRRLQTSIRGHP